MFECPDCGRRFRCIVNLPAHYRAAHLRRWLAFKGTNRWVWVCRPCLLQGEEREFETLHGLRTHISKMGDERHMAYGYLILTNKGRRSRERLRKAAVRAFRTSD